MAASQLAGRTTVVVADGALVSHCVCFGIPYYMRRLLGWGGREFLPEGPLEKTHFYNVRKDG